MRTLRLIGIAIVAVLLGMNLTACSDDDDDNNNEWLTNSTSGSINGHDYVNLGLSVKWATCNVGATSPYDYGNYYAWGETSTKASYTVDNCQTEGKEIRSIAGNSTYDAARANWGSTWRLPTKEEIEELVNNCTWEWFIQGEHKGCKVTGPNGNSIFLPAAGRRMEASLYNNENSGYYWSATPEEKVYYAYYLTLGRHEFRSYSGYRYDGQSVRPVSE